MTYPNVGEHTTQFPEIPLWRNHIINFARARGFAACFPAVPTAQVQAMNTYKAALDYLVELWGLKKQVYFAVEGLDANELEFVCDMLRRRKVPHTTIRRSHTTSYVLGQFPNVMWYDPMAEAVFILTEDYIEMLDDDDARTKEFTL